MHCNLIISYDLLILNFYPKGHKSDFKIGSIAKHINAAQATMRREIE